MTTWRVEAWSHPLDPGGFDVRDAALPILSYSGNDPEEPRGRVQITLPATYDWRNLIAVANPTDPADTSFLRVYREGVPNTQDPDVEYLLERFSKRIDDDLGEVVDLFGVDWRLAGLDTTALRWFDWAPGNTRSVDPDWSYGLGRSLTTDSGFELDTLPNAGFEEGTSNYWQTPEGGSISAIEDPVQAESGDFYGLWNPAGQGTILRRSISSVRAGSTYTVTVRLDDIDGTGERIRVGVNGAESASHTNAYEVDGVFYAELGNATQGNGSTDGTWQLTTLTFVALESPVEILIEYLGINDHNIAVDSLGIGGAEFGIGSWIAGGHIATMNIAEISTEQAHSGTRSLKLQGSQPAYIDAFGRISYIAVRAITEDDIALIPGKLYTVEVWVYHLGAGTERFITWAQRSAPQGPLARTITGGFLPAPGSYWMAGRSEDVPPNTWTRLTWTSIADTSGVKLGVAWHGGTTDVGVLSSPTFYVDDFVMVEGLSAKPWGVIANDIIDDANVDHVAAVPRLTWLTGRTWTDAVDSGGAPWPRDESINLRRGQKYGRHIFGGLARALGYEYDITPNTTDPTQPEWDMHIWGDSPRGVTHDDIGFHVGVGASGGLVAGRIPKATRWLAEGADGLITEAADTAQETATGVVEDFIGNPDITDSPSLLAAAQTSLNEDLANRLAITFELDDSAPTPYEDFNVADRAQFAIPGTMDRHERRVSDIALAAGMGEDGSLHWTPTITASKLLTGDAAVKESIYRLLTAFERMPEEGGRAAPRAEGGPFGTPTIVVAAADASAFAKASAHFTCTGTNDDETINDALNQFNQAFGADGRGGRLLLTEGTYNVRPSFMFPKDRVHIQGMGASTVLRSLETSSNPILTLNQECQVTDLTIEGPGGWLQGIYTFGEDAIISRVRFINLDVAIYDVSRGTVVADNHTDNVTTFVEFSSGSTDVTITGNSCPQADFELGTTSSIQGGTITGNTMQNLLGGNLSNVVIADNVIEGEMDLTAGTLASHISITGNYINGGAFGSGIRVTGKNFITITDNIIVEPRQHGITLTDCNDSVIRGNLIEWPGQDTHDTYDGIHLAGDSNRNDIWYNRITGSASAVKPRWAINVSAATCDDNSYVGNRSGPATDYGRNAGATTTPYNDAGTGTIVTWPGAAAPQGDNLL